MTIKMAISSMSADYFIKKIEEFFAIFPWKGNWKYSPFPVLSSLHFSFYSSMYIKKILAICKLGKKLRG